MERISRHSQQNKKYPEHHFAEIGKLENCVKFQRKSLDSMVAGARQSFQIFRQNTWFLKYNRAFSKVLYWILHYLISTIKL